MMGYEWNPKTKRRTGQKNNVRFSHEYLAIMIKKFQRRGGLIQRLEEQAVSRGINALPKDIRNYSGYEPLGFNEPPVEAGERGE